MADNDDDVPRLSADTLRALEEFYAEQLSKAPPPSTVGDREDVQLDEDWQLSQFWYDQKTTETLAIEALRVSGNTGRIACVCCPTLYRKLRLCKPASCNATLFEYDKRFQVFGDDYVYYDYKTPLDLDEKHRQAYDVVVADPPFLSEECLANVSKTIKFLCSKSLILCTGSIMEVHVKEHLDLRRSQFAPTHEHNLGNDFSCFANYDIDQYLST